MEDDRVHLWWGSSENRFILHLFWKFCGISNTCMTSYNIIHLSPHFLETRGQAIAGFLQKFLNSRNFGVKQLKNVRNSGLVCTDKKLNKIFLIYKETQWSSCKVIYEEGLPNIWGNAHFICRPSDSTESGDAGVDRWTQGQPWQSEAQSC